MTDMEKARKECTHSNPADFRMEYIHSSLSLFFYYMIIRQCLL
ncbi:hypothetical protein CLONEX_00582 [[Clostridium] nexile DSM 1787]|nr:hypothetical protein CLONEX_00582 [[Clostridium] nexile DSM 1787]